MHLEIATSLSTDAGIMAIRRLCARRGNPAHIYSDNGTNFKGADRELKRAMEDFDQDQLKALASGRSFEWHFNPPSAPYIGGGGGGELGAIGKVSEGCPSSDSPPASTEG